MLTDNWSSVVVNGIAYAIEVWDIRILRGDPTWHWNVWLEDENNLSNTVSHHSHEEAQMAAEHDLRQHLMIRENVNWNEEGF